MLKVGLTGSIGSGKTLVSKFFFSLGVPVYHADVEAKKFLLDENIKNHIVTRIGNSVFDDQNNIVSEKLASIVFNDHKALSVLNSLIHPLVRIDFIEWLSDKQKEPYVLHEAAILYESGFYKDFDKVITVSAPEDVRIKRVMERDRVLEEDVLTRMRNQWKDERKSELADYVIINDGKQMMIPQVLEIHRKLLEIAGSW